MDSESLITIEKCEPSSWPSDDGDPFFTINPSFDLNKVEPDDVDDDFEESDPLFQNVTEKSSKGIKKKRPNGKRKKSRRPAKSEKRLKVRYVCPKCAKIFTHVRLFNEHLQSHDPENRHEKKHKCPYSDCGREFGSQIGLKNHLNYHSSRSETEGYKCFFCHREFESVELLSVHIAESHEDIKDSSMLGHSYSSSLERLLKNLKRKKWHTCDKCSKKFGNINIYKKHLETHDDSGKNSNVEFKCKECSQEFFSKNNLRTHFKTSNCSNSKEKRPALKKSTTNEDNSEENDTNDSNSSAEEENEKGNGVQCSECSRQFSGVLKLDIHLVIVHQKEAKCSQCGKICPNGPQLLRHQSVHKLPRFKCHHESCTAAFRTKEGLTVHRRKHDGILPHICKLCQEGFQSRQLCIQHRIDVHGENLKPLSGCSKPNSGIVTNPRAEMNPEYFTCQFCGKSCTSKDALRLHLKRYHGKDIHGNDVGMPRKYPCTKPGCDAVYKDPSRLVIHQRKHEGLPPYVCPVCQQGFAIMRDWIDHRIDVHKENLTKIETPGMYQCETCGNTYKYLRTLEKHVKRNHTGQKNFECDICNKKFSLICDLRKHQFCHTRVGSFICEECGLSLSTQNGLRRHSMLHKPHSERPFQCQICGHGFVEKGLLVEHGKIHTGEKAYRRPRNSLEPKPKKIRIKKSKEKKRKPREGSGNDGKRQRKKYICEVCFKNFYKKSNLVLHLTNDHGIEYQDPIEVTPPAAETKYKKVSTLPPNLSGSLNNKPNDNKYNNFIPTPTVHFLHPYVNTGKEIAGVEFSMEDLKRSSSISNDDQPVIPDSNVACRQNEGEMITREEDFPSSSANQHSAVNKKQDENLETVGDTTTKLEPSFESDMELDDFFGPPSPEQVVQESSNEQGTSTKVKREKSEASLISRNNLSQLSEKERQLVKKILGPRPRIPILKLQRLITYPCKLCAEDFHRKVRYDSHCRSVRHRQAIRRIKYSGTEEKSEIELDIKRKCSICNDRFDSVKNLTLHHSFEHPNQKGFSCHLCGTAYSTYSKLRRHQIVDHNKEGDFQCVICNEKYSSYEVYREHVKTRHKVELKCPLCGKGFTRVKKLDDHCKATHPGEKSFTCDICSSSFSQYKDYRNHRSDVHNENEIEDDSTKRRKPKERRIFPSRGDCEICGKTFANIRDHRRIHGEKNNLCHLCGKSFRRISELILHNQRHLKDTRFPCTECPKQFYTPSDLRLHFRVHTHKYSCSICSKKFPTETRFKRHQGLHDPKRPLECHVCKYRFITSSNLTIHIKNMHPDPDSSKIQDTTTPKPKAKCLICPFCCKEFSTVKERNEHKLTHPKEEQIFKCRTCPKTFQTISSLSSHVLAHHSSIGELQCTKCAKIFRNMHTYRQHRQEHAEIARGVQSLCYQCGHSFPTKRKLRTHRCKSKSRFTQL